MNPAVLLIAMIVFGVIGYAVGNGKGRGGLGAVLGGLLGLIGVIIVAVMGPAPGHEPGGSANRAPSPQSGPPKEPVDVRLAKLDELKQRGVLSEEEYGRERQRVLADV